MSIVSSNPNIRPLAFVSKNFIEIFPLVPGAHHITIRPFTSNTTQVEWKSYGLLDQRSFGSFYDFVLWLNNIAITFKVEYRLDPNHKEVLYAFVYFIATSVDLKQLLGYKNTNTVCLAVWTLNKSLTHTPFYVNQLSETTKEMIVCNYVRERETVIQQVLEDESTIIKNIPPKLKASRYLHLVEQESVKLFE